MWVVGGADSTLGAVRLPATIRPTTIATTQRSIRNQAQMGADLTKRLTMSSMYTISKLRLDDVNIVTLAGVRSPGGGESMPCFRWSDAKQVSR